MDDLYYYDAVDDINENGYTLRPDDWRESVKEQMNYLIVLDQLSLYIYNNDENILNIFSECCEEYY